MPVARPTNGIEALTLLAGLLPLPMGGEVKRAATPRPAGIGSIAALAAITRGTAPLVAAASAPSMLARQHGNAHVAQFQTRSRAPKPNETTNASPGKIINA